jgi:hypothetical protein
MVYVKVNETLYPARISGKMQDKEWDGRESKAITVEVDFATLDELFPDGTPWSIVNEDVVAVLDDKGNETTKTQLVEYDNSDFSIRGDIIVHVDGTCTVKMGKPTDLEDAYEMIYGGM